jgi:hypothetical protein
VRAKRRVHLPLEWDEEVHREDAFAEGSAMNRVVRLGVGGWPRFFILRVLDAKACISQGNDTTDTNQYRRPDYPILAVTR